MNSVPLNYIAILVAAIASMVIGAIWYGPLLGKTWMSLSGVSKAQMESGKKKGMANSWLLMALGSLVMSFVLANAIIFSGVALNSSGASTGLMSGFFNWLGFIAPVTMGSVLWEGKTWKLWLLNNGYYLISLLVMGVILAAW